jgi:hypothetical protein
MAFPPTAWFSARSIDLTAVHGNGPHHVLRAVRSRRGAVFS